MEDSKSTLKVTFQAAAIAAVFVGITVLGFEDIDAAIAFGSIAIISSLLAISENK